MIASMYDDGANAFQAFLMLGSPVYGGAAGYLLVATGRLRPGGGVALAAAIVSASLGLMHATELIFTDAVASDGAWVLAMPSGSLAAAALLGAALFQSPTGARTPGAVRRGWGALHRGDRPARRRNRLLLRDRGVGRVLHARRDGPPVTHE